MQRTSLIDRREFLYEMWKTCAGRTGILRRLSIQKDNISLWQICFFLQSRSATIDCKVKYHGRQEYASYYGRMMYKVHKEWIQKIQPDMLLPVPVHKKRLQQRGYNQAELIAKELGVHAKIPVVTDWLCRQENTLPQKELSAQERFQNLQGAFAVKEAELYTNINCVIIIDDIYTTGSTIEACSQVMRKIGVQNIYFLCLCSGQAE